MCCFSQPVELVADTNIFARSNHIRQFLVYSMSYTARSDLAMVLPLPVPTGPSEDAVRFINLQYYPTFFDDMRRGFPPRMLIPLSQGGKAISLDAPKLRVHDVGDFEASFVPRITDFDRLDERFRIPADVWGQLPSYQDYGFAVFKLKSSASRWLTGALRKLIGGSVYKPRRVHPMAFTFLRRNPELLYFPTVHVHDREVHPQAMFDHMLYCQPDAGMEESLQGWERSQGGAPRPGAGSRSWTMNPPDWERSPGYAAEFMDVERSEGIVDPGQYCWRLPLEGLRQNRDTLIGKGGVLPELATI